MNKKIAEEEIKKIIIENFPCYDVGEDEVLLDLEKQVAQAQAKVTLKEVGEWLETRQLNFQGVFMNVCIIKHEELEYLLRGEMPK